MARRAQYAVRASQHFVSANRCLFGADDPDRGFTGANGIERQMGRPMGVRNRHYSWGADPLRIGKAWQADAALGVVPMVSLGGQGYSEQLVVEIGQGKHDDYWKELFANLAPARGLLRPWMEMNGSHNSYSADPAAFIRMWSHVRTLDVTQTWIFCPQAADPKQVWPRYLPPPTQFDWMGIDLYRHVWSFADPWRTYAQQQRKPFCVCESGFEQGAVVTDSLTSRKLDKDGSKTGNSLIRDTRAQIKAHPNTVMYLVWNSIGPVGDDFIDTSAASLEQYREFASDPYFQFSA